MTIKTKILTVISYVFVVAIAEVFIFGGSLYFSAVFKYQLGTNALFRKLFNVLTWSVIALIPTFFAAVFARRVTRIQAMDGQGETVRSDARRAPINLRWMLVLSIVGGAVVFALVFLLVFIRIG